MDFCLLLNAVHNKQIPPVTDTRMLYPSRLSRNFQSSPRWGVSETAKRACTDNRYFSKRDANTSKIDIFTVALSAIQAGIIMAMTFEIISGMVNSELQYYRMVW